MFMLSMVRQKVVDLLLRDDSGKLIYEKFGGYLLLSSFLELCMRLPMTYKRNLDGHEPLEVQEILNNEGPT